LLGGTFQEIQAALDDDTQSLLEGIIDKNTDARHRTILEGLRDFLTPGKGEAAAEEMSKIMVAGHEVQVGLPKGAELKDPDGDGIYSLFYHNKELCNKVSFDAKGNLTDEARAALASRGVHITETMPKEGGEVPQEEVLAGVSTLKDRMAFIEKHPDLFKKITHDVWYDEDTPAPMFDHNELRLDWGGKGGIGVNENGDYVFSIKRMTADGSWHKEFSVDAHAAAKRGELSILLSMSHDTEQHVIEIPINEHFEAVIPKGSEAGEMLFKQGFNGHAVFLGDHAEVSQMMGKTNQEGAEWIRVLATHSGEQAPVVPPPAERIPIPIFEIPPQTDLPPVIPILGRRPMERMKGPEVVPLIPYYAGYEKIISPEQKKFYLERFSDNLRKNPEVVLDFKEEANLYLKKEKEKNSAYYKDLQEILKQPGMAEPMHDNCRVAVCIPVYDLGEGKIIEHALDQYRKQIKNGSVKADEFELILFLNHPKDKLEAMEIKMGAEERVQTGNPEAYDTEEVIKQYRVKYPELKIRVMKKEFPERPKWGWIIKYDYDAALMRARERKNASDEDIVILTNDVDARDMSDKYLKELISDFDQNKREFEAGESRKIDGIVGRIDHDEETYKMWPNFFVATRFDQFLDAQVRRGFGKEDIDFTEGSFYSYSARGKKGEKHVITQGRNTAIRGSVYSAIGGANTETDAGADTELGRMVTLGRRGVFEDMLDSDRYPFKYNNKVWLNTDPRRELGKYKQGDSIAWAWGDWAKMDVYGKSFKEQIQGEKEDLNKERLEFEFENILKKWNLKSESVIVKRALFWLGFKKDDYHIGEGKVKIDKLENLQTHLNEWMPRRERWQKIKERKGE